MKTKILITMKNGIVLCLSIVFSIMIAASFQSCQKDEEFVAPDDGQLKSATIPDYFAALISSIETYVDQGIISKGTGSSLISKVNSAIKSAEKGNVKAAQNQLKAVMNAVDSLVNSGKLTEDQGRELASKTEISSIFLGGGLVDERDGNIYQVVLIGNQIWMAENLRTTVYSDLTPIPYVADIAQWENLQTPGYCWYDNNENVYRENNGGLYNWYAVSPEKNGGKNICPEGWQVPSFSDWNELLDYLQANGYGMEENPSHIAKSMASDFGWTLSPFIGTPGNDQSSNNKSGFSGKPAGLRSWVGHFYGLNSTTLWWASDEYYIGPDYAWCVWLSSSGTGCSQPGYHINYGLSVRCIKN